MILTFLLQFSFAVNFKSIEIKVKNIPIMVELAVTDEERSLGLMNRVFLKKNTGMLFVFKRQKKLSFWMKNTKIPLSIAFFNKNKILIDMQDMQPGKGKRPRTYSSTRPAIYALEMNIGWFERNSIGLGSRLYIKSK